MRNCVIILLLTCACLISQAQVNYINTIAGKSGVPGSDSGNGGPAMYGRFFGPISLCIDISGNIYIADVYNNRIRKIAISTGIITTIAGTDSAGYSGDGGPATNAKIWYPCSVRNDTLNNIYFTDGKNNVIRKVSYSTGIITTIAGSGVPGYTGDEGAATAAELDGPMGLCLDRFGNIYFGDFLNNTIRKVNYLTGIISTIAGTGGYGYSGDGGPATNATFSTIWGICADSFGNIYLSDQDYNVVRKITVSSGIITTIAGNGTVGHSGDGGLANDAQLNQPAGVFIDGQNNIYVAEFGNGVVRRVDGVTGIITTVAGDGTWGWAGDGGPATDAELSCTEVAIDNSGCVIIADYGTNTIRKVYNTELEVKNTIPKPDISIYPNPANDELTIKNAAGGEMGIYNILGQKLINNKISSEKEPFNIRSLTAGTYIVHVTSTSGEMQNLRLIKE